MRVIGEEVGGMTRRKESTWAKGGKVVGGRRIARAISSRQAMVGLIWSDVGVN